MANSLVFSGAVQFQAPAGSSIVSETFNLSTSLAPLGNTLNKTIGSLTNSMTQQVLTGISNTGTIVLRNLDNTNAVFYGPNATSQAGLIQPNGLNIYSPNGNNLYAATNTGTAQLQIFAISG